MPHEEEEEEKKREDGRENNTSIRAGTQFGERVHGPRFFFLLKMVPWVYSVYVWRGLIHYLFLLTVIRRSMRLDLAVEAGKQSVWERDVWIIAQVFSDYSVINYRGHLSEVGYGRSLNRIAGVTKAQNVSFLLVNSWRGVKRCHELLNWISRLSHLTRAHSVAQKSTFI